MDALDAALANVEQLPLNMMINFVIWEPSDELFDEAVESANLTDNDIVEDFEFQDACVSLIAKRLKTADHFWCSHAVNTLLVRLVDEDFMSTAGGILVAVAERLTPAQQRHVANKLRQAWKIILEKRFEYRIFPLIPMLAKKQPDLGIDVHLHVTQSLDTFLHYGSIDDTIGVIDAISDVRRCLKQETCDVVCERLRVVSEKMENDIYADFVAPDDRFNKTLEERKESANWHVGIFREAVEKALKRLSRSSMTWTRMLPKVRVIGCLSLMCAESAERLYRPGGAGATAAIGRLVAGAKRQRSEV